MGKYDEEVEQDAQGHATNTCNRREGKDDDGDKQTQQQQKDAAKKGRQKKQSAQPRRSLEEAEKAEQTDTKGEEQYGNHESDTLGRLLGEWMETYTEEAWQEEQEHTQPTQTAGKMTGMTTKTNKRYRIRKKQPGKESRRNK